MIQRIFATLIIAALYFFFAVHSTLHSGAAGVASLNPDESLGSTELQGAQGIRARGPMRNTNTVQEISVPLSSSVAQFDENDQSWAFSAKVMQLKDVSIYGRPGTIAQIEYVREGEIRYAWAVIQIDDYYFTDHGGAFAVGQEILLEIAGPQVSPHGVNWDGCPPNDIYCGYARFIEGGFPTSEDYNGLTICPSNRLIYSGDASSDWINGMLAWKIKTVN